MPATFVLLSFEGPDPYASAGGLGSRVTDLSAELAAAGYQTHLFFVGDPSLPGHEVRQGGRLHLHRWCQWVSQYHPRGVYDGEDGKIWEWEHSLPEWLSDNLLEPEVEAGNSVVVMAEEWHTAASVIALRRVIEQRGWRDQVFLLWNANNPFGFDRLPWGELQDAAVITTVSRYMRTLMSGHGVEARVLPNGITDEWLHPHEGPARQVISDLLSGRTSLTKIARWDPDKGWTQALQAVGIMKRMGMRPLLFARGGLEGYGHHVLQEAWSSGLEVRHVRWETPAMAAMVDAVRFEMDVDVLVLDSPLTLDQRRALFVGTDAVLANSGREPFGLVGLEAMAAGGIAMVGCSGEDYVTAGYDSISLQTKNPWEIVHNVAALQDSPVKGLALRTAARQSAARYTWAAVINRCLLPVLEMLGVYGLSRGQVSKGRTSVLPEQPGRQPHGQKPSLAARSFGIAEEPLLRVG